MQRNFFDNAPFKAVKLIIFLRRMSYSSLIEPIASSLPWTIRKILLVLIGADLTPLPCWKQLLIRKAAEEVIALVQRTRLDTTWL